MLVKKKLLAEETVVEFVEDYVSRVGVIRANEGLNGTILWLHRSGKFPQITLARNRPKKNNSSNRTLAFDFPILLIQESLTQYNP